MICTRTLKDLYKSFKRFIEKVRTNDCQSTLKRLRKYVERVEKAANGDLHNFAVRGFRCTFEWK